MTGVERLMRMRHFIALYLGSVLALALLPAEAKIHRSGQARQDFKRQHPCPATGRSTGKCPGFVIDHKQGLCVGGEDHPRNMMWMTRTAAAAKDRWECKPGWHLKLHDCEADLQRCTGVPV